MYIGFYEYEMVAVVANAAPIHSAQELRGSRLCHPGHGLQESHLTDVLANVSIGWKPHIIVYLI